MRQSLSAPPQPIALRPISRPSPPEARKYGLDAESLELLLRQHRKEVQKDPPGEGSPQHASDLFGHGAEEVPMLSLLLCEAEAELKDADEQKASEECKGVEEKTPEVALREFLCLHAQTIKERDLQLLAAYEERAAQAFKASFYEEEAARLREWSYAYEAAAKAEAFTAQRYRSEMVTAVQELQHVQRLQQHSAAFLQIEATHTMPSRLEPIAEDCGWSSPKEEMTQAHQREDLSAVASTVSEESAEEEMKALILKLQKELLDAEASRSTIVLQRDEANEALQALRKEHSALVCSLNRLDGLACQGTLTDGCVDSWQTAHAERRVSGVKTWLSSASTDPAGRLLQAKMQLTQAMEELRSLRWAEVCERMA